MTGMLPSLMTWCPNGCNSLKKSHKFLKFHSQEPLRLRNVVTQCWLLSVMGQIVLLVQLFRYGGRRELSL